MSLENRPDRATSRRAAAVLSACLDYCPGKKEKQAHQYIDSLSGWESNPAFARNRMYHPSKRVIYTSDLLLLPSKHFTDEISLSSHLLLASADVPPKGEPSDQPGFRIRDVSPYRFSLLISHGEMKECYLIRTARPT